MDRKEIADKVLEIIAERAAKDLSELNEDIDIRFDGPNPLHFDSLDVAEYLMNLEEACGVKVVDEDVKSITTIRDLIDYIAERKIKGYKK